MIIDDGLNHYTMKDGKKVPIISEDERMGVDGQTLYTYNGKTGHLKLNPTMFTPKDLESIALAAKAKPDEGIEFALEIFPLGEKMFYGVKSVSPLSTEEQKYDDANLKTESQSQSGTRQESKKTLVRRIRDTFAYYTGW